MTKPYAVIDGSMSPQTDNKIYDVTISGIDGQLFMDGSKTRNVKPGFRLIQLTTTKADRRGDFTYTSFPIVTKPCIRYYVAAKHASSLKYDNKSWEVVVIKEEEIPSCMNAQKENQATAEITTE
jgi:hypothetical protein